jgi:hypothetical protein
LKLLVGAWWFSCSYRCKALQVFDCWQVCGGSVGDVRQAGVAVLAG